MRRGGRRRASQAGQRLAAAGVHAMLDCSDGLALDASRMAEASRVTVAIELADVPMAAGVAAVAAKAPAATQICWRRPVARTTS